MLKYNDDASLDTSEVEDTRGPAAAAMLGGMMSGRGIGLSAAAGSASSAC